MDGDEVAPLSPAGVVRYLIGVGLLDAALVVRGKVRVEERSRRNLNFLVHCGEGGLFVKQGLGVDKRLSVGAEGSRLPDAGGLRVTRKVPRPRTAFRPRPGNPGTQPCAICDESA